MFLNNLAIHLSAAWWLTGDPARLHRAIACTEEAVARTPRGHDRAMFLDSLGNRLGDRWRMSGQRADLDRSISCTEEALRLDPAGPNRAGRVHNLGLGLVERWRVTGDRADRETAVACAEEAVELTPTGPDRALYVNTLANHLGDRWGVTGERSDLDRAVAYTEEAVSLTPTGPDRPGFLSNLATHLDARWRVMGERSDLDRVIECTEEAVELTPTGPVRASCLNDLGNALADRYLVAGDEGDLNRAVACAEEAVAMTPTGPARAMYVDNLGNHLSERCKLPGWQAETERALACTAEAVELTPAGTDRAGYLNNLGNRFSQRWDILGDDADLDRAVASGEEAVALTPTGPDRGMHMFNLGTHLAQRWHRLHHQADLEAALGCLGEAVDASQGLDLWAGLQAGRALAYLGLSSGRLVLAAEEAERVVSSARQMSARLGPQAEDHLVPVQGAAGLGAVALCHLDQPAAAVELLEQGLGVLVAERLSRVGGTLERAQGDDALAVVPAAPDARIRDVRARDAEEEAVNPLVADASLDEVLATAWAARKPLVYLLASVAGGLALVVSPLGTVEARWLEGLHEEAVEAWVERLDNATAEDGDASLRAGIRGGAAEPEAGLVEAMVAWLAEAFDPLGADLADGVLLVPTGTLSRLPVSAAVARTGAALPPVAASARLHGLALANTSKMSRQGLGHDLLAVTDPRPCTLENGMSCPSLPGAAAEGRTLASAYGAEHRTGEDATKEEVLAQLRRPWSVLHLGVHGVVEPHRPQLSRALFRDGPAGVTESVAVGEVAGRLAGARLVFLACCWLGQAGLRLPDEAVGFPTVLVEQGAGAVIAPLWPVADAACQAFVEAFYAAWIGGGLDPAEALAEAQARSLAVHPRSSCWATFVLTGG